jgi:hypothetical protein
MTTIDESCTSARDIFASHTMFRREFGLMPGLVRAVRAGDMQRATLVADHVALVSNMLSMRNSAEKTHIWPRLRERCPKDCASLADVMEAQYHAVHTFLLQVTEAAQAWQDSASADTRGALADAIEHLIPVTVEHLALKEQRVVPLAEMCIAEAEYAVLAQELAAHVPPDKLAVVFGMIMYDSGHAVIVDNFIDEMPVEVRPAIKDLAVQAYGTYAAELYGTARPAHGWG